MSYMPLRRSAEVPNLFSLVLFISLAILLLRTIYYHRKSFLMSEDVGTTQTMSSNPPSEQCHEFNQSSVDKCLKLIDDFGKGLITKGEALLEVQTILQSAISESSSLSQTDFKPGFAHYLDLLDCTAEESANNQD
ncbi:hypothetical protein EDD22DRAFT_957000 [Suillus occidentalis]|nr:hypothetical protein EDD22DRAFT_957000 [Suillus occidentalis]